MKLHALPSITDRTKKRLGRGHGSGKVKTAGRGQKGQKARGKVRLWYEGGQVSLRHALPFLRGKGRNKSKNITYVGIPLSRLSKLSPGSLVTLETLKKAGIVEAGIQNVKLLAGPLSITLSVSVPCTKGAQAIIEKAGGTVSS